MKQSKQYVLRVDAMSRKVWNDPEPVVTKGAEFWDQSADQLAASYEQATRYTLAEALREQEALRQCGIQATIQNDI